jgi:murein DD-endopeptidase MepM/ murein hydrolase activator NlpD
MVRFSAQTKIVAVSVALALVAGCTRGGPPAPAYVLGEQPGATASAPPPAAPPEPVKVETARIEPPKIEPAKPPPPPSPPSPPVTSTPQPQSAHPDQVTVGKGETLYMIARRFDLPLRTIIDANHLEPPYQLAVGTTLTLPQERFHTVQAGDTLYSVSRRYGVEVSTLASLNHLAEPYAIRSGETLFLPPPAAPVERVAFVPPTQPSQATVPTPPVAPAPPSAAETPPATKPVPSQAQAKAEPPPVAKPGAGRIFAWPLEGRVIEAYGTAPSGTHNDGINIAARMGEPVRAAEAGKVAYAGNELRGYGNLVLIKHSGGYMTAYAHNSKLLVKRGQVVARGQEIAKAGATGTVSAPQLHFEIRQGTHALDPANYLPSLRASAG